MPKAGSSGAGREALRRNQACRQCRKRKLKCDAQKPHCSTCVKQWTAQIAVPPPVGFSHPPDPRCQYDHNDALGLQPTNVDNIDDPKKRVDVLERQIAELQSKLNEAQQESAHGSNAGDGHDATSSEPQWPSNNMQPYQSAAMNQSSSNGSGSGAVIHTLSPPVYHDALNGHSVSQNQSTVLTSPPTTFLGQSHVASPPGAIQGLGSPFLKQSNGSSRAFPGNVDLDIKTELQGQTFDGAPFNGELDEVSYDLIFSGWNRDLPDPRLLHHLVMLYFSRDACASRILHRPSFLFAMTLPPTHPDFPHPALLHAICASASRWTLASMYSRDTRRGDRDKFAEFHANKTRMYIDQTIASGQNIFSVLLGGIVIGWWFYHEGRWVDVWRYSGFLTRVSIPLGLNHPGTTPSMGNGSPYLSPPNNATDLEQRRRAWWLCVAFDRISSVGGWPHSVDERDIGTELPLRRTDFEADRSIPSNPQDFASEGLFIRHIPAYTDPFTLFIKACLLFGRVTDYNTRTILKASRASASSRSNRDTHSASFSSQNNNVNGSSDVQYGVYKGDPRLAANFRSLDRLVAVDFLANLPVGMKSCLGVQQSATSMHQPGRGYDAMPSLDIDGAALDTDLYLVHLLPHAATITLHNTHMNFADPSCPSVGRCLDASKAILNAYLLISSTSFDVKRLHPSVVICWYLAAVVLIQLCKRLIQIGDTAGEAAVWGEINMLRLAMLEYGTASPIGIRQEKLLQGLLAPIIQLTSQMQPLSVGVPLYPFSRNTLFDPTFQPPSVEIEDITEGNNNSESHSGALAGRTGERLRAATISVQVSSPSRSPDGQLNTSMLPGSGSGMGDDFSDALGMGSSHGYGTDMISAQGIWKATDYDPMLVMGGPVGNGNGSSHTTNIFEELGL
ncbi:hypothetical protein FRB94_003455 [Tulasnella sp. JGI-2019a]|nr:hypothetical protein FRB94_003455 [Tulasnella sp. JGI-2019a]